MPRTHLITGAGSGIGAAIARRLADRGDRLILLARTPQRSDELSEAFPASIPLVADLARPETLADAVAGLADLPCLADGLRTVVHAAGIVELGEVATLSLNAWTAQLTVNTIAPAELTRVVLPQLRAARGTVVFLNSGAGLRAHPQWAAYGASKHALKALADALREEEAPHGVRVSTVYPGRTATPMQEEVHRQERASYDPGRFIDPESVATAVLTAIDLPADATLTDITVRPGPR